MGFLILRHGLIPRGPSTAACCMLGSGPPPKATYLSKPSLLWLVTWMLCMTGAACLPHPQNLSGSGVLWRQGADQTESTAKERLAALETRYLSTVVTSTSSASKCNSTTLSWRQEWTTLSATQKRGFINAVHCLARLPSKTNATVKSRARGVVTRYDDFVLSHIESTPFVHTNGFFLPFHRHFLHMFESELRSECRFTGPFPYWDWTLYWEDPGQHPVFDGSELSFGGNGAKISTLRQPTAIGIPGNLTVLIPPATGGGCVETGPFSKDQFSVHLGPVGYEPKGPDNGLGYNPRCITRDLSPYWSRNTSPSKVVSLIDSCGDDLGCVITRMDFDENGAPGGVHAAGHWQIGLTALDVYASPADPMFWLHHAQVDRVWTMWQGQDPTGERTRMVWGTQTAGNDPPSGEVTLDTLVHFPHLGEPKTVRELVSTVEGEYCYAYKATGVVER
ncbi:hypothetical protein VTJ49DRAFT_3764 [Mycothermus thermophilus]|uniref:Tyrosinase copper-binding domain-containing protein n=1 Tax=Humicola insolens TaxID=85995 RepID=A0ABR3V6P7_HUMIN